MLLEFAEAQKVNRKYVGKWYISPLTNNVF